MNILFTIPAHTPFVGGAQTFARAVTQRLAADGHAVTVLTTNARRAEDFWAPSAEAPLPAEEVVDGVRVVRLSLRYPSPAPYRFGLLRRTGHWLARSPLPVVVQRPLLGVLARSMPPVDDLQSTLEQLVVEADVVHAIDAAWDGLFVRACAAARRRGTPCIAIPLIHSGSARIAVQFRMAHQVDAYRRAPAVVALSRPERAFLARLGVPAGRVHVLPMGVDPSAAEAVAPLPDAIARWYNGRGSLITFLGAATEDKGAFTLAQAVARLAQQGEDVHLACAGSQQEGFRRFLEAQPEPQRSILRQRIHLLGIVDEATKHALLEACTALALPSRVDSFGIALLEAWLHGKPVVVAAAGGLVDTVDERRTGLLVPYGDVDALAVALEQLLCDPVLATRLGEAGRRCVAERYTWDRTYQALWQIYDAIDEQIDVAHLATTAGRAPASALPASARVRARDERNQRHVQ